MFTVKCLSRSCIPSKGTTFSAGIDLMTYEDFTVKPNECIKIPLRVSLRDVSTPANVCFKLEARSSFAAKGLAVLGGLVDSDYTGEIFAVVTTLNAEPLTVKKYTPFVQLVPYMIRSGPIMIEREIQGPSCERYEIVELIDVRHPDPRGDGGFGSTN